MGSAFQIHKAEWFLMAAFLFAGGLFLLFKIDFLWGVICFVFAFTCFYQGNVRGEKGATSDKSPAGDD
jgi:hypothetical protein